MRLFVAILFSEEWNRALFSIIKTLRNQTRHGNFTRPENLHLTLAFLGDTDRLSPVRKALSLAAASCPGSFPLTLDGTGRFGEILWAGVSPCPALSALSRSITLELCRQGFPIQQRHFQPHITLARHFQATDVQLSIPRLKMDVTSFSLMESAQVNGRLTYTEVSRFDLTHN